MVAMIVGVAIWFGGVDWSWFVVDCPDCFYSEDVFQYRVFGIACHEEVRPSHTIPEMIARDLGAPCPHRNITMWHKHRRWGLWHCAAPCINGVYRIHVDLTWYDQNKMGKVKSFALKNPESGGKFRQRALYDHDYEFRDEFLKKIGLVEEDAP